MKSLLVAGIAFAAGVMTLPLPAPAQQVDAYFGIGTARDSSNGNQIDTFGDGNLNSTSSLGGAFTNFGVNVFFNKQLGVGYTAALRWSPGDYAGLQYHTAFHTFDAIFQSARLRNRQVAPELRVGIGLANVSFDYDDPDSCSQVPGCPGSHHFLAHAAVAARLYLTPHVFLRPAVDVHYVKNFFVFGSNWVPRYSLGVGYSFGRE